MRTFFLLIAAAAAGLVLGCGVACLRWHFSHWDGNPAEVQAGGTSEAVGGPQVAVDQEEFSFGTMDAAKQGSHDFLFTNRGTQPLELSRGATAAARSAKSPARRSCRASRPR